MLFIAAISAGPAIAADTDGGKMPTKAVRASSAQDVPQIPGDDIFGFTSPTDVGNPGDTMFVNENDGRTSKRQEGQCRQRALRRADNAVEDNRQDRLQRDIPAASRLPVNGESRS